ncbi:hypothetical protein JXB41_07075 [Candidatus Woesearchaeota archaeon]|nr:hypothetical protein [Candidatus Woesearchaeota archaeon]
MLGNSNKKENECFFCNKKSVVNENRDALNKRENIYFQCESCGNINRINADTDSLNSCVKFNKLTHSKINNAKSFLSDVPEDKVFYAINGKILKNLEQAAEYIKRIDENVFRHHVNENKNDFHNWISHVIGDDDLAKKINKHKRSKAIYKTIKNRVDQLKKRVI